MSFETPQHRCHEKLLTFYWSCGLVRLTFDFCRGIGASGSRPRECIFAALDETRPRQQSFAAVLLLQFSQSTGAAMFTFACDSIRRRGLFTRLCLTPPCPAVTL
ncbi:hypothetical protein P153DRAFT_199185 [Dothidotthia symphoricarpi CBS 119687]|uniref:Uncharacterized protein n=1 Tax=Dothidotthia symphoricarpi CBS 119687 TaxID=1392245 RepID=A0A6A6AL46_9PLEO|nr:uncharacterized protein P153DRAFT_199185 [Dothidotthia symphoricarpi CBS 119687]KAF2131597.1 hypothetical protein P153DRAFT_199185 [Dothidotthia symphoricarpi CBS 119687]